MQDLETVAGKLRFVAVPAWLEENIQGTNHGREQLMLNVKDLTSILSVQDVQKYLDLNTNIYNVFIASGLNGNFLDEGFARGYLTMHSLDDKSRTELWEHIRPEDTRAKTRILFNYFNDSDKVVIDENRYYYEIIPFYDTVMGIYIRLADSEEEAKTLQEDALRRAVAILRRYVSLKEVAKSGFLGGYLDSIQD